MPTKKKYAVVYKYWGGVGVTDDYGPPGRQVGLETIRVYDINQETGELTEHGEPRPKVTVEQVREFIMDKWPVERQGDLVVQAGSILDFIDNGPPKPTAEDVIEECIESDYQLSGNRIARALREAGYLKDEA